MLPDRVSNPGPLTYESGALPIALRGPHTATMLSCYNDMVTASCSYSRNHWNFAFLCSGPFINAAIQSIS